VPYPSCAIDTPSRKLVAPASSLNQGQGGGGCYMTNLQALCVFMTQSTVGETKGIESALAPLQAFRCPRRASLPTSKRLAPSRDPVRGTKRRPSSAVVVAEPCGGSERTDQEQIRYKPGYASSDVLPSTGRTLELAFDGLCFLIASCAGLRGCDPRRFALRPRDQCVCLRSDWLPNPSVNGSLACHWSNER